MEVGVFAEDTWGPHGKETAGGLPGRCTIGLPGGARGPPRRGSRHPVLWKEHPGAILNGNTHAWREGTIEEEPEVGDLQGAHQRAPGEESPSQSYTRANQEPQLEQFGKPRKSHYLPITFPFPY